MAHSTALPPVPAESDWPAVSRWSVGGGEAGRAPSTSCLLHWTLHPSAGCPAPNSLSPRPTKLCRPTRTRVGFLPSSYRHPHPSFQHPPPPPPPPPCTSVLLQGAWCASLYSTRQCLHLPLFPPFLPSYLPLIHHLSLYPYPNIHHVLPIPKFTPSIRHMPPLLYTRGPKPRP